jgi:nitrite reductase/ring-hydroxylating ferredoxin subunit
VNHAVDAGDLRWTAVGNAADWPEDSGRLARLGARRIGVYRHAGGFFALKDVCPHAGVALSQGPVADGAVMCVGHGWTFRLADGEVVRGATGYRVATYPVRVVDGVVEVGI